MMDEFTDHGTPRKGGSLRQLAKPDDSEPDLSLAERIARHAAQAIDLILADTSRNPDSLESVR